MYGTQISLFDGASSSGKKFNFFHFSEGPLRFVLHINDATKRHFYLRLQHNNQSLLDFGFYENGFLFSKACKGSRQNNHSLSACSVEGHIPESKGKDAIVLSDFGFFKVNRMERNRSQHALLKAEQSIEPVTLTFYGSKLKGEYVLRNYGDKQYDTEIWHLEKPNIHTSVRNLTHSIITGYTPSCLKGLSD